MSKPLFKPFCFVLLTLSWATQLRAGLNLSPMRQQFDLDGVTIWRLTFENGTKNRSSYQPPGNWTYAGSSNELQLQPPGKTQATVAITKVDSANVISFEEGNHQELRQKAIALLPEGSSEIKVEREELNPLQISGKDTYLVQLSYTHFGENFRSYFLLLNLSGGQLQFRLTSRERDYEELVQIFQKSLYSWQHLT